MTCTAAASTSASTATRAPSATRIEDFDHDVLVKANAIELLRRELAGKRRHRTIGTGSMNDPYMPLETKSG